MSGARSDPGSEVAGYILAGGGSSRFGPDKALALLGDRPLLSLAVEALEAVGLEATVVTPRPEAYRLLARRFLDAERPGHGPVEGLRVILDACPKPWALVLAVDMPWIGPAALQPLLERRGRVGSVLCYAAPDGLNHPFPGLYPRTLRDRVAAAPEGSSMQELLAGIAVEHPSGPDVLPELLLKSALRNVNRPEDLEPGGEDRGGGEA